MISVCYSALALWLLGRPDLAVQKAEQTLILARQRAQPYNLAWCLTNLSIFHMMRRDWSRALQMTQEGLAICAERGFVHTAASMSQLQTVMLAGQGNIERANQYVSVRKAAPEISGQLMHAPWFCTTLAEIYGALGQIDTAFSLLRAATSVMTQTNERFYEAETHRIMGELLFHQARKDRGSQPDGAGFEDRFLEAITIARKQGARTLELRAATGLSRCWQSEGREADARHLLTPIYDTFTEGFDTDDLQQAAALLKELR
jgi:predicted ATPase